MGRIELNMPQQYSFSTEVEVRIGDINYGGHLGNDALLSLIHEARMRYFAALGYTELSLAGVGTIMADSAIVYKSEAFFGDKLRIEMAAGDLTRVGFDLFYKIVLIDSLKLVAEAKTGIICFDYQLRKVVQIPEEVRAKLKQD